MNKSWTCWLRKRFSNTSQVLHWDANNLKPHSWASTGGISTGIKSHLDIVELPVPLHSIDVGVKTFPSERV